MKKILFATGNPSKAKRFANSLEENGIELLTLNDMKLDIEVEENGKDAIENALIKARAYYNKANMPIMAMDDNLFLEGVPSDKQPGMYVRRIGGKRLTDQEMLDYYINLVKTYGTNGKLNARWKYGIAIIKDGREYTYSWSKEGFDLVDTPSVIVNPGYPLNSISVNKKLGKYFTDITEEEKKLIKENESDVIDFIVNIINQ